MRLTSPVRGGSVVDDHEAKQGEGITRYLSPEHSREITEKAWSQRRAVEKMSNQLYIQSVAMRSLVINASEETASYFAQRKPREIAKYEWFIDAKDPLRETPYETWWKDVLGPLLESHSREKPFPLVNSPEFNYHFFRKSYDLTKDMWFPDKPRETGSPDRTKCSPLLGRTEN